MNSLVFAVLAIILQTEGLRTYLANNTIGDIYPHSSLYTGSPVKLIDAELIEVDLGDRLTLNCSSSSYYATEFLEIGQQYTIDEKLIYLIPQHGNPAVSYVPTGCQHSVQDIECCRVLEITVVQLMDRRSYLCRATEKQGDQAVYYSDRSYLLSQW